MNKQQYLEKCRGMIVDKIRWSFLCAYEAGLYDMQNDTIYPKGKNTAHYKKAQIALDKSIKETQSKLSESWDMGGEALEPKLAKLLLPEAMSDNDERNKTFAFGYNSASKEVNKKIRTLIDSLTSKQEGEK